MNSILTLQGIKVRSVVADCTGCAGCVFNDPNTEACLLNEPCRLQEDMIYVSDEVAPITKVAIKDERAAKLIQQYFARRVTAQQFKSELIELINTITEERDYYKHKIETICG